MDREYRFLAQMIRHGRIVKVAQFSVYGSMPRVMTNAWIQAHDGVDPVQGYWVNLVLLDDEEKCAPAGGIQEELPLGEEEP